MLLPLLRERVNAALGPGTVGRIQLTQAGHGFAEPPAAFAAPRPAGAAVDLGAVAGALSSIGDGDLRDALETLARNVLSRSRTRNHRKAEPWPDPDPPPDPRRRARRRRACRRLALAQATPAVAEMSIGDPNAPVTLVEYAMFTCPHCAAFSQEVLPKIKANYIDTGKVRLVFREVYFNKPSLWAAMIARCAPADRYFGIVDVLFAHAGRAGRRAATSRRCSASSTASAGRPG